MANNLRIEKLLDTLPETILPNTLYFVLNLPGFDMYLSDKDGVNVYQLNTKNAVDDTEMHALAMYYGAR